MGLGTIPLSFVLYPNSNKPFQTTDRKTSRRRRQRSSEQVYTQRTRSGRLLRYWCVVCIYRWTWFDCKDASFREWERGHVGTSRESRSMFGTLRGSQRHRFGKLGRYSKTLGHSREDTIVGDFQQKGKVFTMSLAGTKLVVGTSGSHIDVWDLRDTKEPLQERKSPWNTWLGSFDVLRIMKDLLWVP